MFKHNLIGSVACRYLRDCLNDLDRDGGTSRYILDNLSADQVASIALAILEDPVLDDLIDIKLPEGYVSGKGLPDNILTAERATYFRNAECDKEILLVASVGDDEQQSLRELSPIGSSQLIGETDYWVQEANSLLSNSLRDEEIIWWNKALTGLQEVKTVTIDVFSDFILEIINQVKNEGEPFLYAIGLSLPVLRIPKDKMLFDRLNDKTARYKDKWKALFNTAVKRRACFIQKYLPTHSLLTDAQLSASFDKHKDTIAEKYHSIIENFIKSPSGWNDAAKDLCNCEWDDIHIFFDGIKKEKYHLGKKTLEFYSEREPSLLSDDEREYLKNLARTANLRAAEDDEREFYEQHRYELKEDNTLKVKWDNIIYRTAIETEDLITGLLTAIEPVYSSVSDGQSVTLQIRSDKRTISELKKLNVYAGAYFVKKYKGLLEAIPGVWAETGELFNFSTHLKDWETKRIKKNRSKAKAALQVKLYLEFKITTIDGKENDVSKQVVWKYNPETVSASYADDLSRLKKYPFSEALSYREISGVNIKGDSLDLKNTRTLHPAFGSERGSLIPRYTRDVDISIKWEKNLEEVFERELLPRELKTDIQTHWTKFKEQYREAIVEANDYGVYSEIFKKQAESYGRLLNELNLLNPGDRARDLLIRPLLSIGVAHVEGGAVSSIVAPWHPLRLLAVYSKTRQLSSCFKKLLKASKIEISDSRLFFKDTAEALADPYYPEITVGWLKNEAEILSRTDFYLDYSLHESPIVKNNGLDETNENPTLTSNLVVDLLKRYLKLFPHERANLSAVLYNCDSARLPQAVMSKVTDLHNEDGDMRCEIVLRHRDKQRLADVYEKIVDASDLDADVYATSENTTDFMARLRIGIMAEQARIPSEKEGRPTDIVFLQDVIARQAKLEWYLVERHIESSDQLCPPQWSRRKTSSLDDMKSVTYLTIPIQTDEGWSYLKSTSSFFKPDWNSYSDQCFIPARQLDFSDNNTAEIFKEIHNLGNWVANYDELLDRRQLLNQNVQIIRYKQTKNQGRNILISSTAPTSLLRSMVKSRINSLNLDFSSDQLTEITDRFIDDANKLSGDLALRAAKRGNNASELMGVVLSKYMTQQEIGQEKECAWFFLDDYAEWLGQKEEQIADILALCPEKHGDTYRLGIIVTEAKYIHESNLKAKQRESQKQTRDTVNRIRKALFSKPACLDRDLWVSRFCNMITSNLHLSPDNDLDILSWQEAFRRGNCEVYVKGYSHIFVYQSEGKDCSDSFPILDIEDCFQETYSRDQLRELVKTYYEKGDSLKIRQQSDDYSLSKRNFESIELPNENVVEAKVEEEGIITNSDKSPDSVVEELEINNASIEREQASIKRSFKEALINFPSQIHKIDGVEEWLNKTAANCRLALQQFQLRAKLLEKKITANCAILKFEGSSNLTVDKVKKKQTEFLTSYGLDVTDIRPEPGIISISIARQERELLTIQDAWKKWTSAKKGSTELLVGIKEEDNQLLIVSPQKHSPHTLIAGSTGSGKSVLMQNILLSIIVNNTPEEAQIILIDPKIGVDYFAFEGLPHLKDGIIDDPEVATEKLSQLVLEMDRRYQVLRENRVQNIIAYNEKAEEKLPVLWVIHDEFADWMMEKEYKEHVSSLVGRLGVKARAAGIFLIFASQRPDNHVMPLQLRSQLGNRLILRVDSEGTSEISLGEKGAEKLLGKGHMVAKLEGEQGILFSQVPFVSEVLLDQIGVLFKETNSWPLLD